MCLCVIEKEKNPYIRQRSAPQFRSRDSRLGLGVFTSYMFPGVHCRGLALVSSLGACSQVCVADAWHGVPGVHCLGLAWCLYSYMFPGVHLQGLALVSSLATFSLHGSFY